MKKYLPFLFAAALLTGCYAGQGDGSRAPENKNLKFSSFVFETEANPQLEFDYSCPLTDDGIDVHFAYVDDSYGLVPTFEGNFSKVTVNGVEQVPGQTPIDFNRVVNYELHGDDGSRRTFPVRIVVAGGLPVLHINTRGADIKNKVHYVDASFRLCNVPEMGVYEGDGRIRGRGNATWGYAKKPYRIKLDEKASILGMPANKDWVLLAEYCDKSLLRDKYLFTASELAGMPYTIRSQHVEVYINGFYVGLYLLTEVVEEAKNRVNIEKEGFIIESDNYWYNEPLNFKTDKRGVRYTFKYPDPDDEIAAGDDNYNYIVNFMNLFESVLYSEDYRDPEKGYRRYIDAESFARWYLVQELLGNIDTNPYYVLRSRGAKLQMYPVWDSEWSLGLADEGGDYYGWAMPPAKPNLERSYWRNKLYFGRLISDPYFAELLCAEWARLKPQLPELRRRIAETAESLTYAQARNFRNWPVLGSYLAVGLVAFDTWREEVDYADEVLMRRAEWLDGVVARYPD